MIYVIVPAYNEEQTIRPTLVALESAMHGRPEGYLAVVVDDGSTDDTIAQTEAAVAETGGELPLQVLRHEQNQGLGAGVRTGIYWVLERADTNDVVVMLDGDNTHPPRLIPMMLDRLARGYDLVIASRYRPGSRVTGVPGYRRALSDVGRILFQVMFPIRGVRDYTCCFRAYRIPPLQQARLIYGEDLCTARGFEAVMDLLLRLRQVGIRATEVPLELDYSERVGQSKMRVLQTIRSTMALLARRFIERFTTYSESRVRSQLADFKSREMVVGP
ncbi:MAG: glycosyltransferase family 2 protein [Chloroflexota bacterium]